MKKYENRHLFSSFLLILIEINIKVEMKTTKKLIEINKKV